MKKVKQVNGESKAKGSKPSTKPSKDKKPSTKKGKKSKSHEDDEGSEEGWEDVDDEYDITAETK